MCNLLNVKLIWCSGIPRIYGQLELGTSALSICAFCYMCNIFGLVVFSIDLWLIGGGACILDVSAFCYMLN